MVKNKKILFVTFYETDCLAVKLLSQTAEKYGLIPHIVYLKKYNIEKAGITNVLKSQGYDHLINGIRSVSNPSKVSEKEINLFIDLLEKIKPGLILVSTRTFALKTARNLFKRVKEIFNVPVISGGWGPILQPEEFLEFSDYICVGEGEKCFEKISETYSNNRTDFQEIKNLQYKSGKKIIENPLFPPLTNEEYEEYYKDIKYSFKNTFLIENNKLTENYYEIPMRPRVFTAKGCPFRCSYCMAGAHSALYKRKGLKCKQYRTRSVDSVINELKKLKRNGAKFIEFKDEVFPFNKKWLNDFLDKYRSQIALPFWGYLRPELHSTEIVKKILESGLYYTTLGIQSGSEYIRKEIYKRSAKKTDIINFAHLLKKTGISYAIHLISKCPFEKENDLIDTLNLVYQLPYSNIIVFYLAQFPGSPIDLMIKQKKPKPLPDKLYRWYSILYCMAAIGPLSRMIAKKIHKNNFFKNRPDVLINYYTLKSQLLHSFLFRFIPETVRTRIFHRNRNLKIFKLLKKQKDNIRMTARRGKFLNV